MDNGTEIVSQVGAAGGHKGGDSQDLVGHVPEVQLLPGIQRRLEHGMGILDLCCTFLL